MRIQSPITWNFRHTSYLLWTLIVVCGGLLLFNAKQQEDSPSPATTDIDALRTELVQLQATLNDEQTQRQALEARIEQLELLANNASSLSPINTPNDDVFLAAEPSNPNSDIAERFASVGISVEQREEIEQRAEEFNLARLYLQDQASREGWLDSDRYTHEIQQLPGNPSRLRSELGDDLYDRYLYGLGENNRVIVATVIDGSPAEIAGIQAGDLIQAYAGERIFHSHELQVATGQGSSGEIVALDIQRGNARFSVYVPRGPLGIRMETRSDMP